MHDVAHAPDATRAVDDERTLATFADDTARAVLRALDDPLTAKEVADDCDVGLSTAYRKLEDLAEAGLCRERIAVRPDGHHVTRYERAVDRIAVSFEGGDGDDDGGLAVRFTPREEPAPGPDRGFRTAASD
ncbi:helix-turn-helix domain-containing protein [Halobaculum sp. EA56]|uniref:helix-turn-helix domain-containing protein n=1 Tax=Halobaculum sp. EA56 TaxID=3421648 RepID=UPI003EBB9D13